MLGKRILKRALNGLGVEIRKIPPHPRVVQTMPEPSPERSLALAVDIIDFISKVDPFYLGHSVSPPLEIGGAWGGDLRVRRANQIRAYESKDLNQVVSLHNDMFFNELIAGLWNHCYWEDVKGSRDRLVQAQREIEHVSRIWPVFRDSIPSTKLAHWGFGANDSQGVLKTMVSAWHFTQLKMVENASELASDEIPGILEIGSGFGGLAEFLAISDPSRTILLVDIPLNLTTCYFYLRQSLPESVSVFLHSSAEDVRNAKTSGLRGLHLIPSCFYPEVDDWAGIGLACNFASFSEMDLETVNYYLEGLPADTKVLVQVNSNEEKLNADSHREVPQDRFNYPKGMKIVQEGPVFENARYKASVMVRP